MEGREVVARTWVRIVSQRRLGAGEADRTPSGVFGLVEAAEPGRGASNLSAGLAGREAKGS